MGTAKTSSSSGASRSIWNATFVALLVVNFFQSMSAQIGFTIIPLDARDMGVSTGMVGAIVSSFAITALGIRPFSGPAFDSFPKKPLFFAAFAVNAVAVFLYAIVQTPGALFAVRLLHGIGIGCGGPLGMAICNQVLPPEHLSSGISIYMLAFTVAQSMGPAFALWLAGMVGYSATFIVSGCLMCVACALIPFLHVPERADRPPYQIRLDRILAKQALVPALLMCLLSAAFSAMGSFLIIYGMLRGVSNIGLFFTVYALCLLVTRPVFGRMSDTRGTTVILVPAMICFALSYVIIAQASTLPLFLAASVVGACGFGICTPLVQALTFRIVPPERSGAGSNTTYTGLDVGNLIGPAIAGGIVDALWPALGSEVAAYSAMWLIMIAPIVAALLFYLSQRGRIARYTRQVAEAARPGGNR